VTPFVTLAKLSAELSATSSRNAKVDALASTIASLSPDEVPASVGFLSGEPRFGKVGVGYAKLSRLYALPTTREPKLSILEVEERARSLGDLSSALLDVPLRELFVDLVPEERSFLGRVMGEGLRQGSLEGVMLSAVAKAYAASTSEAEVRRATMTSGSLASVAESLAKTGTIAEDLRHLRVHRPVLPMLAAPSDDAASALAESSGRARADVKMDGVRVQIHKSEAGVQAFSRQLNEVTAELGSLLSPLASLPARSLVLDGEVVAFDENGRPLAFQDTMSRFARTSTSDAAASRKGTLRLFVFDLLLLNDRELVDEPLEERLRVMSEVVPTEWLMPGETVTDAASAEGVYLRALEAGHEGLVMKRLDSRYVAGTRDAAWLKVKKAITVDLVVLGAEWGHGRRDGYLSNLHLGARAKDGTFVMVGKTFKGLTDAMLAEQTRVLLELEDHRDENVVFVRPRFVVEVAFSDVQRSPRYPAKVALRLARVKRFRPDKNPSDVEPIESLAALAPAEQHVPKEHAAPKQLTLFASEEVSQASRKRRGT
jgi:DNA ligase-1